MKKITAVPTVVMHAVASVRRTPTAVALKACSHLFIVAACPSSPSKHLDWKEGSKAFREHAEPSQTATAKQVRLIFSRVRSGPALNYHV